MHSIRLLFRPMSKSCNFSRDCRYPANQLILVTGLLSFANFLGFVLNYILVLPDFLDYGLWIGVVCITPAYLHILLNLKTKFKRFESEM